MGKNMMFHVIFQIWIKKEKERYIEPIVEEKGFHFVKRPSVKDTKFNEKKEVIKEKIYFLKNLILVYCVQVGVKSVGEYQKIIKTVLLVIQKHGYLSK